MKILFTLTRAFNPNDAGVQRTTYKMGKFFTEQGHEVGYFSTKVKGHVKVEFGTLFSVMHEGQMENQKNVVFLTSTLNTFAPDIVINQMPYEKQLRETLVKCKEQCRFILIGCLRNSLFNFYSNVRLKSKEDLNPFLFKVIDNPVGLWLIKKLHVWKHRKDLKAILDAHDYYVLLAPQNRDELNFFVGNYQNHKVSVIPNSIPGIYPEVIQQKEKIILYVGSLNIAQKRADLLAEFWKQVVLRLPDWRFVIVGHGEYSGVLQQTLEEEQLPRVSMEGFQKPEPYYSKASIFMMPSAYEGFPNTILEAQSHGCPVLAFDSYAALRGIVNDGSDALLSAPYDVSEMASHAVELANSQEKMSKMQKASLENASQYTIEKVGATWLKFFNEIRK